MPVCVTKRLEEIRMVASLRTDWFCVTLLKISLKKCLALIYEYIRHAYNSTKRLLLKEQRETDPFILNPGSIFFYHYASREGIHTPSIIPNTPCNLGSAIRINRRHMTMPPRFVFR